MCIHNFQWQNLLLQNLLHNSVLIPELNCEILAGELKFSGCEWRILGLWNGLGLKYLLGFPAELCAMTLKEIWKNPITLTKWKSGKINVKY